MLSSFFEDKYSLVHDLNNLQGYCIVTDPDGNIHYINSYFEKLIKKDIKIKKLSDLVSEKKCSILLEKLKFSVETNTPLTFELKIKNNLFISNIIPFNVNGSPHRKAIITGYCENNFFVSDFLNIIGTNTETIHRNIKIFFDNFPFGVAVVDENDSYLYINPKFIEMFGYTLKNFKTRKEWFDLAYPTEKEKRKVLKFWNYIILNPEHHRINKSNFQIRCKDNHIKNIIVYSVFTIYKYYFIFYQDITEEQKLKENYYGLVQNAPVGIFQMTKEGNHMFVNDAYLKILGYSSFAEIKECLDNKTETDLYTNPEERRFILSRINKGLGVFNYETQFYKKNKEKIWVYFSLWPIIDENDNIIRYQGIVEDITEKKKKEIEIETLQEKIYEMQKFEALSSFARNVAHDFNNMLMVLMGNLSLLKIKLSSFPTSNIQKNIDSLFNACEQMKNMTNALLTFGRRQSLVIEPLNLIEETKIIFTLLKTLINKNIKLNLNLPEKNIYLKTDKTSLYQLFLNLVVNSIHAIEKDGNITTIIEEYYNTQTEESISGKIPPGKYVKITFEDDGCGIPQENIKKVFEPFFTTKEKEGTGLGLSIVYKVVQDLKGYIQLESSTEGNNRGTRFRFFIPLV